MSTSGVTNTSFSGSSTFAAQLQNVITVAISRASAPLTQLQTEQTDLSSQQSEAEKISSAFGNLQSAVQSLSSATGLSSMEANVGSKDVLTTSLSSGVLAGTYSVDVTSIGSQTNTLSGSHNKTVSDPGTSDLSSSETFTLSVNGQTFNISNSAGTLNGLVSAINGSGAAVQATLVNVGSTISPDYRLSIQGSHYAADTIQLNDGQSDLLETISTGSAVTYQINGEPSDPIASDSRTVTISPGLTAQLLATGQTSLTVSQSTAGVARALSSFATAYNAAAAELANNRGQSGGALTGQSLIGQLQQQLRTLATYSGGNGEISSLTQLGLSFDSSGTLSFDSTAFNNAVSSSSTAALASFLGDGTSSGFIKAADDAMNAVTGYSTGSLTQFSASLSKETSDLSTKISDQQTQINLLQQTLTTQMANADAAISSLENQVSEITNLFSAMQTNSKALSG